MASRGVEPTRRSSSPLLIKWGCVILLCLTAANLLTLQELRWRTHFDDTAAAADEDRRKQQEELIVLHVTNTLAHTSLTPTTLPPTSLAPTTPPPTLTPTPPAPTPLSWWWKELGLEEAPFYWQDSPEQHPDTDERTALEAIFPCGITCAVNKNDTNSAMVKRRAACLENNNNSTFLSTCAEVSLGVPSQVACARNATQCRKTPAFHLRSGRDLYSLADVAMEIARHKKTDTVHIRLLGDSIAKQIFDKARCHLMRSVRIGGGGGDMASIPAYSNVVGALPRFSQRARSNKNAITTGLQHTFLLPRTGQGSTPLEVKLTSHTAYRVLVDDEKLHMALCSSSDLLVSTWGLHYTNPLLGDYAEEMQSAVRVWERCAREHNTTVFFAGHPMQHFFEGNPDTGQYINGKWGKQCAPMPDAARARGIDRLDGWSQVVRNQTAALRMQTTPWSREDLAYCPSSSSSSSAAAEIHWFPWVEVTQDFSQEHPNCKKNTKPDCSHLTATPQLFAPMWDAMFLAVARDGRLRRGKGDQCDKALPPPEFSSLAKHRNGHGEHYSARLQESFNRMFRHPARGDNAVLVPGGLYDKDSARLTPEAYQANEQFALEHKHKLRNDAA